MLYREIIAVCSEIHTKRINTLCGQNVELLNVKLAVHKGNFLKLNSNFTIPDLVMRFPVPSNQEHQQSEPLKYPQTAPPPPNTPHES